MKLFGVIRIFFMDILDLRGGNDEWLTLRLEKRFERVSDWDFEGSA